MFSVQPYSDLDLIISCLDSASFSKRTQNGKMLYSTFHDRSQTCKIIRARRGVRFDFVWFPRGEKVKRSLRASIFDCSCRDHCSRSFGKSIKPIMEQDEFDSLNLGSRENLIWEEHEEDLTYQTHISVISRIFEII